MDLTRSLVRFASARPRVLLAELPGGRAQRLAVETALRGRGWPAAANPADADILVVAGPAEDSTTELVNRLWTQVPQPRAYAHVPGGSNVRAALDSAQRALAEGTGAGGQGVPIPGEMAMADRGADRDGLRLDQLHVPLGPFLPDWPAGLVLHTTLQGDLIQQAEPALVGTAAVDAPIPAGADLLDSLARLLAVAGWVDAAARARLLRDGVLGAADVADLPGKLARLIRRVRHARTLRWLTDGLGVLPRARAERAHLGDLTLRASHGHGDVTARWMTWLADLERSARPGLPAVGTWPGDSRSESPGHVPTAGSAAAHRSSASTPPQLAVLPELVEGAELASARLIVASFDPDLKRLPSPESSEVSDV